MAVMVVSIMMLVVMVLLMLVLMPVVVMMMVPLVALMAVVVLSLLRLMLCPHFGKQLVSQGDLLHRGEDGFAVQLVPGRCENGGAGVLLPQQCNGGLQFLLTELLSPGEDNRPGRLNLIIIELAKVLHIDLDLCGVRHSDKAVQLHIRNLGGGILHRHNHIAELANAGGLNQNPVRLKLGLNILEGLVEVPHQRTADASGGHLADLHAGLLQKAAVNADLTELIFDEHQLLPREGLR